MTPFTFNTTPSIRFGAGLLNSLGDIAAPLLGARILIITDPGMMSTDMPARAQKALRHAGSEVHIFNEVSADPSGTVVLAARDRIYEIDATGILGLGGGSIVDVAKLAAALAASGSELTSCHGIGKLQQADCTCAVPTPRP